LAGCRVVYSRTEQMSRKMLRNVEKRGVHTASLPLEPGWTGSKLSLAIRTRPAFGGTRPSRLISHVLASHCRRRKLGLLSCSISPSFVLSHNMSMVNTTSNWLCFGAFHPPPVPSLFGIRWLLVTILSPHAPRSTSHGRRGPPSMPRAELGTTFPTRQASTCYDMLRFPVLAEI